MTNRIKALQDALTLAANRLQRIALDFDTGSRRFFEVVEWVDSAHAAIAASQPAPDCHQPDLVTADSSQPAQPVAVNMVWAQFGQECIRAETVIGRYEIMWGFHNGQYSLDVPKSARSHVWHTDLESAKAAAQADYEARIMAALDVQPLTVQDAARVPEIAALIEGGAGIKRIVEEIDGAMSHGNWRDENGGRLKDTPEWVAFYNALSALRAIAEGRA